MKAALAVFRKELIDALRDRRTLLVVIVSSVLLGPAVLVAMSALIASLETQAEKREVYVQGAEHAPALVNFMERQTYVVKAPPADYESQLRAGRFGDPVLVVPKDFERDLDRGEPVRLELVSDSANRRAEAGSGRVARLVEAWARERGTLRLLLRGVSPELLAGAPLDERDLASTQARASQLTGLLPFFVLMAVLYGALNAALDTTAGERERGSLEPLLLNPASAWSLVLGKWGAVSAVGMLIAVLSCLSFFPAQRLLASDALAAMFQFGGGEALRFLALLLPFAAAMSALLMAVAIRSRSFKEAQASSTVVILVASLLPMVSLFNLGGDARWHLLVPALAQSALMLRVLKGEGLDAIQLGVPLVICAVLAAAALAYVARQLREVVARGH
jgi:sodium transport system permease protein